MEALVDQAHGLIRALSLLSTEGRIQLQTLTLQHYTPLPQASSSRYKSELRYISFGMWMSFPLNSAMTSLQLLPSEVS